LFQQEETPVASEPKSGVSSAAFIDEIVGRLEEVMERLYRELYGRHSKDMQELISSLEQGGLLPIPKDDINALLSAHDRVQETMDTEDADIGIAWRIHAKLEMRKK